MKVTVCVLTLVLAMLASSTVNCNSIAERSVGNENKTNFYDFSHSLNSFSFFKKRYSGSTSRGSQHDNATHDDPRLGGSLRRSL